MNRNRQSNPHFTAGASAERDACKVGRFQCAEGKWCYEMPDTEKSPLESYNLGYHLVMMSDMLKNDQGMYFRTPEFLWVVSVYRIVLPER
jgi:hypothetical protein